MRTQDQKQEGEGDALHHMREDEAGISRPGPGMITISALSLLMLFTTALATASAGKTGYNRFNVLARSTA